MAERRVVLKRGREGPLVKRHPWIFSGAIEQLPSHEPGELLPVYSFEGAFLALAYFQEGHSIAGRVVSFNRTDFSLELKDRICKAVELRSQLFDSEKTDAFRLINGEGDFLPGLVVDRYNDHLVIQIHSWGMERLKKQIVDVLVALLSPEAILEKSASSARRAVNLEDRSEVLYGKAADSVSILENGIPFLVDIQKGQKTGFFLDQRKMRAAIGRLAKNRRVLNCFAYTGGFSLYALRGGAREVVSVEISEIACQLLASNLELNGYHPEDHPIRNADVSDFLKEDPLHFDLIILDPPAFAKQKKDEKRALKGYFDLNHAVLKKIPDHSLFLTCSCSLHIDADAFERAVREAAISAERQVRVLQTHLQAEDHPYSLSHPEGRYLKSLLLYISN